MEDDVRCILQHARLKIIEIFSGKYHDQIDVSSGPGYLCETYVLDKVGDVSVRAYITGAWSVCIASRVFWSPHTPGDQQRCVWFTGPSDAVDGYWLAADLSQVGERVIGKRSSFGAYLKFMADEEGVLKLFRKD